MPTGSERDSAGFASVEEQALYNSIKVVISDEVGIGSFGDAMVGDADAARRRGGGRLPLQHRGRQRRQLQAAGGAVRKEVWNSEAQATFGNSAFRPNNNMKDPAVAGTGIGGTNSALEMGNTIIKGFVNSRRTHFIYQPAIGSFYEGGQYSFKEIVSARDPWSGWIHYDAGLDDAAPFQLVREDRLGEPRQYRGHLAGRPPVQRDRRDRTNPVNGRNGRPAISPSPRPTNEISRRSS